MSQNLASAIIVDDCTEKSLTAHTCRIGVQGLFQARRSGEEALELTNCVVSAIGNWTCRAWADGGALGPFLVRGTQMQPETATQLLQIDARNSTAAAPRAAVAQNNSFVGQRGPTQVGTRSPVLGSVGNNESLFATV